MENFIRVNNNTIGKGFPVYIIAEAGVNHNGDLQLALDLVKEAKEAGVHCVKFQTFKASSIVTKSSPKANYQLKVTDPNETQLEMLKKLELEFTDYKEIIALCNKLEIDFLSTPYNFEDVDFLYELDVPAFKIASGQLVELPFLDYVARTNKPILLSTGMANMSEVAAAIETIRSAGNEKIVLLQCTTNYPSRIEDANIKAMLSMKAAFNTIVGYSDHVQNNYACFAAVSLGASVIEKHFTLDKSLPGPGHSSSLNPVEFKELVQAIKQIELSLGNGIKKPTEFEVKNIYGMRRSLVFVNNLEAGEEISRKDIGFKGPYNGLSTTYLSRVIGKKVKTSVSSDTPLSYDLIEW